MAANVKPELLPENIESINIYLDSYKAYQERGRKYYLRTGLRRDVSHFKIKAGISSIFDDEGALKLNAVYEDKWAGEIVLFTFYVELRKKKAQDYYRQNILDILAANGSKRTEAYRRIANDKIT